MNIEEVIRLNKISDDRINVYSIDRIGDVVDDEMCITILTIYGIPKSVSPYIDFLEEEKGGFKSVSDFMKMHAIEGDDIPEKEIFKKLYIFGFFNNNYIVLNDKGEVLYIDYERLIITYINKDLRTFLDIVVKFNLVIDDYYVANPEGDFFEDGFTDEVLNNFIEYIKSIDERSITDGEFWILLLEECRDV